MTVAPEKDFVAVGVLAAHLRCSVRTIETAVATLRLEPAMRLNNITYFDGEQVETLTQHLASKSP